MPTDDFKNDLSADFTAKLHLLRTKYFDSLKEKETELEDIIANISAYGIDTRTLTDLQSIVHNLAGAAPMHGFHEVGQYASGIEKTISEYLRLPDAVVSNMKILLEVEDLTDQIRQTLEAC